MEGYKLTIRIAGNTAAPSLAAIRKKGYSVRSSATLTEGDIGNCLYQYDAIRDGRFFSATSPEELLGLIAMWETRGDDWRGTEEDFAFRDEVFRKMMVYNQEGNIIQPDMSWPSP
ncbi:MAG: hypothetical protein FWC42_04805 [Proteobacteria bacterium]|nr:hypothetical protein [Pseudomonadota bacterium]